MREILFKAKHIHVLPENKHLDGEWVEGYLSAENYINAGEAEVLIDPSTICQYTGLTDKNGKKIWEGDIIKYITCENIEPVGTVIWDKAEFRISWDDDRALRGDLFFWAEEREIEVIGNIFDNQPGSTAAAWKQQTMSRFERVE